MKTLVLTLAGPLQSWGDSARHYERTTGKFPTKSGVIGMLAACHGIERGDDEPLRRLAALRFAVRIDQPGSLRRDFHTSQNHVSGEANPLTNRWYLEDAVFTVALAGDDVEIDRAVNALHHPVYLPFLGRRSCPPGRPLSPEVHDGGDPVRVLRGVPWRASEWHRNRTGLAQLEIWSDAPDGARTVRTVRDVPGSFSLKHRWWTTRALTVTHVQVGGKESEHNPAAEVFD